jgi:signal transduction histidine kinase
MRISIRFCFILLFVLTAREARALDPHKLISQYGHTVWRERDGLVDHPVAITQTKDGYIWIGMANGLMRFDGVKFSAWTPPPGQSLPGRGFSWLLGARDGSLWIGTPGGLSHLENGQLFNYMTQPGGTGVGSIIEDRAGTIWFTRYHITDGKGPLCKVVGQDIQCYGKEDGIPVSYGLGLTQDTSGNFWFGSAALCRWASGSADTYFKDELEHLAGAGVIDVAAGPGGTVWATLDGTGPNLGVRYYSGGKWSSYVVPGFDGARVRSHTLYKDRSGSLWVGTESEGLYHIHDGRADRFSIENGLSGKSVASIYEDREGNLWVLTEGGMDLFRDTPIVTFSTNEGLSATSIGSVLALGNGSVWVSNSGAIDILGPGGFSSIPAGRGLPGQDVGAIFEDTGGRIWLGIDDRLMTYEHGRFLDLKKSDGTLLGHVGTTSAFIEDVDANIWAVISSPPQRSLLHIKDQRVIENIPLDIRRARYLAADRAGGIWIASSMGKLVRYRNGRMERVSLTNDETLLTIYSLFVTPDNALWVATARGLYRLKDGDLKLMDSRNGLPCASVFAAIDDSASSLWLYAQCGLLKISAADLANWIANPETKVAAKIFDVLDGAQPASGEVNQPRAARSSDGRLWFVTDRFVQMIDPARDYTNVIAPPVHIENLVADHKSYNSQTSLNLPPLQGELEIDYTALSFIVPRKVNFRYKLEGHDVEWQEAGTRREAFYNNLGPGTYRFRVIAANNDGVWNLDGATLDFNIAPRWHQTTWFRISFLLAIALVIWMLYRLRIRQISRAISARFDERLAERTRLARDLHDTFLQTIQGSKMVADDALDEASSPARMRHAIEQLSVWLGQATEEGRTALNSLRSSTTEKNDLAEGFRRATEDKLTNGSTAVAFSVIGEAKEMHPIVRDEVYRIGYEAIRNAYMHSGASRLEVELRYAQNLSVTVRDNGVGIDPAVVKAGKEGHFGLQGMRERAERIDGKLTIRSSPTSGTEITVVVPGRFVFRNPRATVSERIKTILSART